MFFQRRAVYLANSTAFVLNNVDCTQRLHEDFSHYRSELWPFPVQNVDGALYCHNIWCYFNFKLPSLLIHLGYLFEVAHMGVARTH